MNQVKDAVEELIEETYLLSLSDEELEREVTRFAEVCGLVIMKHVKDKNKLNSLIQRLAMARLSSLIANKVAGLDLSGVLRPEGVTRSARERRIKAIVRNKRTILKIIGEYEPQLIPLIEEGLRAVPHGSRVPFHIRHRLNQRCYHLILKIGLILLGLGALALLLSLLP